ncbi:L,D-transpeptidase family protein [Novosphingobium sp.]|uniref:L,D-transpeptidase family protein n=1 Tax=Novosphingobium sp. TaxID=1874826 RepID=UPI0025EAFF24|nr:L,D-transpeptidase family protein [Novosphingobium sp.]MCC6924523.1 L,D-transpeptidase family protein [Novosphingobium sp.]
MIRRAVQLSVLCALPLATASAAPQPALSYPEVDRILVRKAERTMTLYGVDGSVTVIRGIQLGDAPVGPKQFEGDERTPEGRFTIDYGNPRSSYHLSLHIDYPRPEHVAHAKSQGRSAGGLIMIHGQPNNWPAGRVPGDWTDGCIALSNDEMDALWEAVPDGTPIEIQP